MPRIETRDRASDCLIALRHSLGASQEALSDLLRCSVVTVARYETTHPPRGDALLRLASLADRHEKAELRDEFLNLYLAAVQVSFEEQSLPYAVRLVKKNGTA